LDALVVNPYDIEGVAEAIHQGLEMDRGERRMRMQRMRHHVMDHNVYRWRPAFWATCAIYASSPRGRQSIRAAPSLHPFHQLTLHAVSWRRNSIR